MLRAFATPIEDRCVALLYALSAVLAKYKCLLFLVSIKKPLAVQTKGLLFVIS